MSTRWIFAAVALGSGMLFGEIAGHLLRSRLSRPERSPQSQEQARAVGAFVFWSGTAVGLFVAVAASSPHAIERIPDRSLSLLPNMLLACLFLIAGSAVSVALSAAVGQSMARASGVRHRDAERLVRLAVMAGAMALALGQLGVDSAVLIAVICLVGGAPIGALTALTTLGAAPVARNVAAGRALRGQLAPDRVLAFRDADGSHVRGAIVAVHPVTVELLTDELTTVYVPLSHLVEHPFEVQSVRTPNSPVP